LEPSKADGQTSVGFFVSYNHRVPKSIAILGSTGSIGTSTLDVAEALPDEIRVTGLVAHRQWETLLQQCRKFRPRVAVLTDREAFEQAKAAGFPSETELKFGEDAACELVQSKDVEIVVSAVVGAAGLTGTWAALEAGKTVALANKETLVLAGQLVMDLAARRGAMLLPVDSEHSAIFQALCGAKPNEVERVVLTASGGPFRGKKASELVSVTPEQALKHPTWVMGRKITIDSATLMNKALEVIEARWLFDLRADQIDAIVHPESIIHSFVEFTDGSTLAQMSPPDMKLPIQYALTYPARMRGPAKRIPWRELRGLTFEPPDRETFRALDLGFEVASRGGTCGAVLNAANEAAVARFLDREIGFLDIARACRAALDNHTYDSTPTIPGLLAQDRWARQEVARWIPS